MFAKRKQLNKSPIKLYWRYTLTDIHSETVLTLSMINRSF